MRPTQSKAHSFTRSIVPADVDDMHTPQDQIIAGDGVAHEVRELQKRTKARHRYIHKHPISDGGEDVKILAAREIYSAWIFRLHVLDGSRIPKYSAYAPDGSVISRKVPHIQTFFDFYEKYQKSCERKFVEKLKLGGSDNLRAFAAILVGSIVWAENDLKEEHLVFNGDSHLTRIDFDQCFYQGLSFGVEDFENLPRVAIFRPHNLIFNYASSKIDRKRCNMGRKVAEQLGPEFKTHIYEAVLKILLMPDFLLKKMEDLLGSFAHEIRSRGIELAPEKKKKLSDCLLKSAGFRDFVRLSGEEVKERILREINSFREHNSYFRKKWSAEAFNLQCVESINSAYPVLSLKVFITTQITRLKSCYFSRGLGDKVALLEAILTRLKDADSELLKQVQSEVSIIMHHRRSRSSHLFTNSPSTSWKEWQVYCRENKLSLQDKPTVECSGKEITSYNAYRFCIKV